MKVYADHAATTPMRPEAKEAMIEALEDFGNPSSIHALGRLASAKMESARKAIAELLNCRPAEVYFTSGGSEADNWAIRAARYGAGDVVASAFEHHAVLHTLEAMERSGTRRAVLVAPGTNGIIDPAEIGRRVSSTTNMVTVMAANNPKKRKQANRVPHRRGAGHWPYSRGRSKNGRRYAFPFRAQVRRPERYRRPVLPPGGAAGSAPIRRRARTGAPSWNGECPRYCWHGGGYAYSLREYGGQREHRQGLA